MKLLRRTTSATLLLVTSSLLASCGDPWRVRSLAEPNPLVGQSRFTYEGTSYQDVIVGKDSEAAHLADKSDEQRVKWDEDKDSIADYFRRGVEQTSKAEISSTEEDYLIKAHVESMEPGIYTAFFNRPAALTIGVSIVDRQGYVVDEVEVNGSAGSTAFNPTATQRFRESARQAGRAFGKFLNTRIKGE